MKIIIVFLQIFSAIFMVLFLFSGIKGIITGKLILLNDYLFEKEIRISCIFMLLASILSSSMLSLFKDHLGYNYTIKQLWLSVLVFLPFLVSTLAIYYFYLKDEVIISDVLNIKNILSKNTIKAPNVNVEKAASVNVECKCNNCGSGYGTSLLLLQSREARVLHCRVCPANNVYTVCSNCSDLDEIQRRSCPICGANNMWEVQAMVPAG